MPLDFAVWAFLCGVVAIEFVRWVRRRRVRIAREEGARRRYAALLAEQIPVWAATPTTRVRLAEGTVTINTLRARDGIEPLPGDDPVAPFPSVDREDELLVNDVHADYVRYDDLRPVPDAEPAPMPTGGGAFGGAGAGGSWDDDDRGERVPSIVECQELIRDFSGANAINEPATAEPVSTEQSFEPPDIPDVPDTGTCSE